MFHPRPIILSHHISYRRLQRDNIDAKYIRNITSRRQLHPYRTKLMDKYIKKVHGHSATKRHLICTDVPFFRNKIQQDYMIVDSINSEAMNVCFYVRDVADIMLKHLKAMTGKIPLFRVLKPRFCCNNYTNRTQ